MTSGRDWLSVILEDHDIPLNLVADEPVTIRTPIDGLTTLEFTLRIRLTEEKFSQYVKDSTV